MLDAWGFSGGYWDLKLGVGPLFPANLSLKSDLFTFRNKRLSITLRLSKTAALSCGNEPFAC